MTLQQQQRERHENQDQNAHHVLQRGGEQTLERLHLSVERTHQGLDTLAGDDRRVNVPGTTLRVTGTNPLLLRKNLLLILQLLAAILLTSMMIPNAPGPGVPLALAEERAVGVEHGDVARGVVGDDERQFDSALAGAGAGVMVSTDVARSSSSARPPSTFKI